MPDESVHCVVTSPPYWGLRDYGIAGQLGLEPTLVEHIETMVCVFREVRRVLRKDGTVWLNYGDCYAGSTNTGGTNSIQGSAKRIGAMNGHNRSIPSGLKPKDLCMVPNRLAIALQDDGWWVRSEIIWHKPNPMPESVTDRPATAHEKIFLLTKSGRYWYDAGAVRTPAAESSVRRMSQDVENQKGSMRANGGGDPRPMKAGGRKTDKQRGHLSGANLRNVWTIATQGFSDAHFATFPPSLVEPCIKAGCPEGGTILDPFGGSGTVGLVADRLGRRAVLIELNENYAAMARRRVDIDAATRGTGPPTIMAGHDLPLFNGDF